VLDSYGIMLYAQSRDGAKVINMRLPSIKAALERLADMGPGHSTTVFDVAFQFIKCEPRA
jgi:hypothetical protein